MSGAPDENDPKFLIKGAHGSHQIGSVLDGAKDEKIQKSTVTEMCIPQSNTEGGRG